MIEFLIYEKVMMVGYKYGGGHAMASCNSGMTSEVRLVRVRRSKLNCGVTRAIPFTQTSSGLAPSASCMESPAQSITSLTAQPFWSARQLRPFCSGGALSFTKSESFTHRSATSVIYLKEQTTCFTLHLMEILSTAAFGIWLHPSHMESSPSPRYAWMPRIFSPQLTSAPQ